MDVIDIQRAGFYGKSEEEIVEFLKRAMDELGLTLEYEVLKELLTPAQFDMVTKSIEKDTRESIKEEQPEMEEDEIKEWVESDKKNRPFKFVKDENGEMILTDLDARMEDNQEIGVIDFSELEMIDMLKAILEGITYNQTYDMYTNTRELETLQKMVKGFSEALRDINALSKRADHRIDQNLMLEVMRVTRAGLNVKELDALVNSNAASIVSMLRQAEANQRFKVDENFSEAQIEGIRKDFVERPIYTVDIDSKNMLALTTRETNMPELEIDRDKMMEQSFMTTLEGALVRGKDSLSEILSGFYLDTLTELIDKTVSPKEVSRDEFDPKKIAEKYAKEPDVIKETPDAERALDELIGLDKSMKKDEQQTDLIM